MGCYISLEGGDDHGAGESFRVVHRSADLREVGTNRNQLKLLQIEDEQFRSELSLSGSQVKLNERDDGRNPLSGTQRRKYIEQMQKRKEKKRRKLERARRKNEQMLVEAENELSHELHNQLGSAGQLDASPQSGPHTTTKDLGNSLLNSGRRKRHGANVNQDGVEIESNGGRLTPVEGTPKQVNTLTATSSRGGMSHPRDERFNALRAWIDESQKENLADPQKTAD